MMQILYFFQILDGNAALVEEGSNRILNKVQIILQQLEESSQDLGVVKSYIANIETKVSGCMNMTTELVSDLISLQGREAEGQNERYHEGSCLEEVRKETYMSRLTSPAPPATSIPLPTYPSRPLPTNLSQQKTPPVTTTRPMARDQLPAASPQKHVSDVHVNDEANKRDVFKAEASPASQRRQRRPHKKNQIVKKTEPPVMKEPQRLDPEFWYDFCRDDEPPRPIFHSKKKSEKKNLSTEKIDKPEVLGGAFKPEVLGGDVAETEVLGGDVDETEVLGGDVDEPELLGGDVVETEVLGGDEVVTTMTLLMELKTLKELAKELANLSHLFAHEETAPMLMPEGTSKFIRMVQRCSTTEANLKGLVDLVKKQQELCKRNILKFMGN